MYRIDDTFSTELYHGHEGIRQLNALLLRGRVRVLKLAEGQWVPVTVRFHTRYLCWYLPTNA